MYTASLSKGGMRPAGGKFGMLEYTEDLSVPREGQCQGWS